MVATSAFVATTRDLTYIYCVLEQPQPPRKSASIKVQRKLNGHFGKVYCVQWMTAEGHTNKMVSNAQVPDELMPSFPLSAI